MLGVSFWACAGREAWALAQQFCPPLKCPLSSRLPDAVLPGPAGHSGSTSTGASEEGGGRFTPLADACSGAGCGRGRLQQPLNCCLPPAS